MPGGVDFLGGLNELRASPFGAVDAFKTYHGAYVQDSWHASSKLTLNYGLRWDWFSREQEREGEQANMVPGALGAASQYLIPEEWRNKALSPSFISNLAKDNIQLVYTDEFGSGLGKMPKNNFAPRVDAAYEINSKMVLRSGYGLFYGAFENRGGNPSLGYNYPFQFTLVYQSPNDTAPNRLPDGSLVGLDARDRLVLDPINVNANGLTLRGVEFDYKTPRYHNYNVTLQTEIMENHSVEIGYVGTQGNHLETFTGMNNVTQLLPPGTNPQNYVQWPDFARGSLWVRTVGVSSYDSLQTKFIRRYHKGLQFLLSYTLSDSKTNAGDSLVRRHGRRSPRARRRRLRSRERHRSLGLPHEARVGVQRQLRSARLWPVARRLADQLGAVDVQRPGADHQLLGGERRRNSNGCYALARRRSVCRCAQRGPVLQPGRVQGSGAGGDDRPDRLQPARRSAQPGHRSADAADRHGLRAPVQGQRREAASNFASRSSTSPTRRHSICRRTRC